MKRYYDIPTQVKFYDSENNEWIGGIAYRDEIICGECGSIFELDEFEVDEVVEMDCWVDINAKIMERQKGFEGKSYEV